MTPFQLGVLFNRNSGILQDLQENISVGLFVSDWASSFLLTEVIGILISEIIGYHVQILPTVGRSAEGRCGEFRPFCLSLIFFVFFVFYTPLNQQQKFLKIDGCKDDMSFFNGPFSGDMWIFSRGFFFLVLWFWSPIFVPIRHGEGRCLLSGFWRPHTSMDPWKNQGCKPCWM